MNNQLNNLKTSIIFIVAIAMYLTLAITPVNGALSALLITDTVNNLEVWFTGTINPTTGAGAPIGGAVVNPINWGAPSMHWDSHISGNAFNIHVSTEHFAEPHLGDGLFGDPLGWTAPALTPFQTMNVNHNTHTDHYALTYIDGAISGLDDKWVFTGTHVPEPMTISLLALGGIYATKRRIRLQ